MRNQKGVTLIDLLLVAAMIGIILAIAVPTLLRARDDKRDRRFQEINGPFSKHLEIGLNDKVIDVAKPFGEWIPADQKAVLRPFVARRLKAVCEDAATELAGWQKVKQQLFDSPADDQHVGLERRLELLTAVNKNIVYFETATTDNGKSCQEAKEIAAALDILSK